MILGSSEQRIKKASWFSNYLYFPFSKSLQAIETAAQLRTEIEILQKQVTAHNLENLELKNQLIAFEHAQSLEKSDAHPEFEIAEVSGYTGQFHERNLILRKGRKHGIEKDSPVVSARGIVGKIVLVADIYSIVLPFSNPQFQSPIMSRGASVQGIFQTDSQGKFFMNMVKIGSSLSVGDTIVCSNLSRVFPKGYPVGIVSRIRESKDNLFISAEINPFTQIENLEHVFILKPKENYNE